MSQFGGLRSIATNARYLRFFGVYGGVNIARGNVAKRNEDKTTMKPENAEIQCYVQVFISQL